MLSGERRVTVLLLDAAWAALEYDAAKRAREATGRT
jgi:hypothetical protein